MDTDSNDGTATESLNGETKPDPAKLAQTAIIKQDVMLSATSTQSPLASQSSVFTMPSVSLPGVSMANNTHLGLTDHLFMSSVSVGDTATTSSLSDTSTKGLLSSLSGHTQLLGQPQVAPQFFIAGQSAAAGAAGAAGATASQLGVQQLLIPVSTGNGAQQFISIPVSMAMGGNQQIQLLTTSNGQMLATNLASLGALAQPLSLGLPVGSSASAGHHALSSAAITSQLAAALPQLLAAGSHSQLLAVSPQVAGLSKVLSPVVSHSHSTSSSQSAAASANNHSTSTVNHTNPSTNNSLQQTLTQAVAGGHATVVAATTPRNPPAAVTPITTSNGLPPSINQLLPNTVGNSTESTTVDGINLDEIKEFARQFKIRRLSLGLTQTQVGQALSATEGPAYSQSAICRFEKLDITPKSAQKIKPVLERWMMEAEERYKNGVDNLTDFIGSEPSKKRKRRTSFTPQALDVLNQYFERNTHPSGAEMTDLSEKLNYDREVIRVWFCNKRQALKNTIKKLKHDTP
ncbi:POU domain, class 6, transcription factor 1 isoform X2 [Patella vulgata]|uniref:POU domain protein n=1 Tax=Patella caerulea TaxID=87958 RepID=A0AAN8G1H6_PATCE|nr:POU domain, class 6, transcription factor 1 isoform X2 [Patella vulgata]